LKLINYTYTADALVSFSIHQKYIDHLHKTRFIMTTIVQDTKGTSENRTYIGN